MDLRIPPLKIKILLESNLLKSRILVRRSAGNCYPLCWPSLAKPAILWVPPAPNPPPTAPSAGAWRSVWHSTRPARPVRPAHRAPVAKVQHGARPPLQRRLPSDGLSRRELFCYVLLFVVWPEFAETLGARAVPGCELLLYGRIP